MIMVYYKLTERREDKKNYIDGNFQLKSILTYGPNSDRNRLLDYDCERKHRVSVCVINVVVVVVNS